MLVKTCTKCNIKKSIEDFHKAPKGKYGRRARCKFCLHKYYNTNKEKILVKAHNRYIEKKEDILKYHAEYRIKNKEHLVEYKKKYHEENKDIINKRATLWRVENRERYNLNMNAAAHRRRAHIHKNGNNTLTAKEITQLFKEIISCVYCGIENNLTLDHIIPISKGGQNCLSNVTVACSSCNSKKSNRIIN